MFSANLHDISSWSFQDGSCPYCLRSSASCSELIPRTAYLTLSEAHLHFPLAFTAFAASIQNPTAQCRPDTRCCLREGIGLFPESTQGSCLCKCLFGPRLSFIFFLCACFRYRKIGIVSRGLGVIGLAWIIGSWRIIISLWTRWTYSSPGCRSSLMSRFLSFDFLNFAYHLQADLEPSTFFFLLIEVLDDLLPLYSFS